VPPNGQNEYNDQLQFEMTIVIERNLPFFDKYETELSSINESQLSEEEKSYEIIKWEVGKQLLKQPTNLMPVHQFWELI
jgi:hypothetical protein